MTDRTATLNFSDGSPPSRSRSCPGRSGPDVIDIRTLYAQDRQVHLRPGLHVDGRVQLGDHLHRRRQGRAALPRLSDRGARGAAATTSRPATCCCTASCRTQAQKDDFVEPRDPPHDGQRADAVLHARLPPRRASDGGADRAWSARCRAFYPDSINLQRRAPARHLGDPPDRQDADAGRDGLQVLDRPAVHVSAQRPVVRGELHADDVRDAVRGLQGQRRAGARARPHLHPARRPRAERVDVDGAAVRVVGHESVRRDRRRRRLPVGPGARRRQRSGAQHALRHPGAGRRREDRRVHRARSRTRTRACG